jgi:hypothetical protein
MQLSADLPDCFWSPLKTRTLGELRFQGLGVRSRGHIAAAASTLSPKTFALQAGPP